MKLAFDHGIFWQYWDRMLWPGISRYPEFILRNPSENCVHHDGLRRTSGQSPCLGGLMVLFMTLNPNRKKSRAMIELSFGVALM
jgi:hypothetical protein